MRVTVRVRVGVMVGVEVTVGVRGHTYMLWCSDYLFLSRRRDADGAEQPCAGENFPKPQTVASRYRSVDAEK